MELNDRDQSLIKKFLFRRLSQVEKTEFSARMGQDQDFREEVEFHRDLFAALGDREHERLKKRLSALEGEHFSPRPQPNYTRWLILALLALLGIGLLWRFVLAPPPPKPQQIFADYFVPFENTVEIATREKGGQAAKAAWQAYDQGNYRRAAALFNQLPAEEQSDASRFFQANALLEEGKAREALVLLEQVKSAQFSEQRLWYAALAYLYLGEITEARSQLEQILSKPGQFKFTAAAEIVKQLK